MKNELSNALKNQMELNRIKKERQRNDEKSPMNHFYAKDQPTKKYPCNSCNGNYPKNMLTKRQDSPVKNFSSKFY